MFRLGITGSIGSGKTTICRHFEEHGAVISISDDLAKEILFSSDEIKSQLVEKFGDGILTDEGSIDKVELAAIAFGNPQNQQVLNSLIHPEVHAQTKALMREAKRAGTKLFVVDAPLLFEAQMDLYLDAVLVVTAASALRQERAQGRNAMSASEFEKRDGLQISQQAKLKRADYVIMNNGSLEDLYSQVDAIYSQIMV